MYQTCSFRATSSWKLIYLILCCDISGFGWTQVNMDCKPLSLSKLIKNPQYDPFPVFWCISGIISFPNCPQKTSSSSNFRIGNGNHRSGIGKDLFSNLALMVAHKFCKTLNGPILKLFQTLYSNPTPSQPHISISKLWIPNF